MATDPLEADIRTIGRLSAVPAILEMVTATTGMGFAAVARVTPTSWTACAVLDKIGFGMKIGDQLDVTTTLCHEIRAVREPIVIEKASDDQIYCRHHTPKMYGFESYISVPIIRRNGEVFGTICALDPKPAKLKDGKILEMVSHYAELIATHLEIEQRLDDSEIALADAVETGALREQFIAVLGHDLRNPLASFMSGLRLLSRDALSPRSSQVVQHMQQSCDRMSGLIDDVLDFARGRLGGGILVDRQPVEDIGDRLREIVAELQASHPDREIVATTDVPETVHCDLRRIGQLLSNLLGNALVYGAPDRPIEVQARVDGPFFCLSVRNQGPAIPAETIAQMFKPYVRQAGTRSGVGLGLGLYIASEIARSHGGTITVASTEAEGTVFTFSCRVTGRS